MALDQIINEFSPEVRARGSAYHRGGAVRILVHSADVIRAAVKGTQSYGVKFQHTNKGVLLLSCTCPYFLDRGPCKHLWATALTAADQGILAKMPLPTRIELDFEEEDRGVQDQHASMPGDIDLSRVPGIPKKLAALLARNHPSIEQEPPASWEYLLDQSRGQVGYEAISDRSSQGVLVYSLATPASETSTLDQAARPELRISTDSVDLRNASGQVSTASRKEILLALLQHGRLTEFKGTNCSVEVLPRHVALRQNIVAWAEKLRWGWPNGGPAAWNVSYWIRGTPRPDVSLGEAIDDAFADPNAYKVGCYTATKLVMIKGALDFCTRTLGLPGMDTWVEGSTRSRATEGATRESREGSIGRISAAKYDAGRLGGPSNRATGSARIR